jgi:hypothetical protein
MHHWDDLVCRLQCCLVRITASDLAMLMRCSDIRCMVAQSTDLDLIYSYLVFTQLRLVCADHGV